MPVSLKKGQKISLAKEAPGLENLYVGLGWDKRDTVGADFDLDVSVFLLDESGKAQSDGDFIFYGHKEHESGAVTHNGDNKTGEGDGDDESIDFILSKIPASTKKIPFVVTIHEAEERKQSFGDVSAAYIRLVNKDNGEEISKYDLSEDCSTETGVIFGELYMHNGEWRFGAVEQGYEGGLAAFLSKYGLEAE